MEYSVLKSKGVIDSKRNLTKPYDVAQANWGGDWRMPTKYEIEELLKLTNKDTIINGVKGRNFYGDNGNTLFLPFVGYREGDRFHGVGESGWYWSATACENDWGAYGMYVNFGGAYWDYISRCRGRTVRPVLRTK